MENQQASKCKREYLKHNKDINHPNFPHSKFAGYRAGCRCRECMIANNIYKSQYNKDLKERNPQYKENQREDKRKFRQTKNGKALYQSMNALHRKRKIEQTPINVSHTILREIYKNCPKGFEVDHIIPISKGGLHEPENLQYLPKIINIKKSNNLDFNVSEYVIKVTF